MMELKDLLLNAEQMEILLNIEKMKTDSDIRCEINSEARNLKRQWLSQWQDNISTAFSEICSDPNRVVLWCESDRELEAMIKNEYEKTELKIWYDLVVFEADLFVPYFPLGLETSSEKEKGKATGSGEYKNLKYSKRPDWLSIFISDQGYIEDEFVNHLREAYKKALSILTNRKEKLLTSLIITGGITAISFGIGAFFAPQIAMLILGPLFPVLSGAALTGASLALFGGGGIAIGRTFMVAGTALIAGSNALIAESATGTVLAAKNISGIVLSNKNLALVQTSRLMVFVEAILIERYNGTELAKDIIDSLKEELLDNTREMADWQLKVNSVTTAEEKADLKEKISNLEQVNAYLKKAYDELFSVVNRFDKPPTEQKNAGQDQDTETPEDTGYHKTVVSDSEEIHSCAEEYIINLKKIFTIEVISSGICARGSRRWYSEELDLWVDIGTNELDKYWIVFGVNDPRDTPPSQTVINLAQTSIPFEFTRSIQGVFAKSETGDLFIAHRGRKFNGVSSRDFRKNYPEGLEVVWDEDRETEVAIISSIRDENLGSNIKSFVGYIQSLQTSQPEKENTQKKVGVSMLSSGLKKAALAAHKKSLEEYNDVVEDVQHKCEELYKSRQETIATIDEIESLINSIANTPKDFERKLSQVNIERDKFHDTEKYAAEAYNALLKTGVGTAAGAAGGATFATLAPTGALWIATTFGTASTGTAISALSGAAATNAALAWLGGGAIAAGGGGMAAGNALLLLAGPVGWAIAGATLTTSAIILNKKNKKIAKEAFEETDKIIVATFTLADTGKAISNFHKETVLILEKNNGELTKAKHMANSDYTALSNDEQVFLGALVNNTLSMAEMLNKTMDQTEAA